MAKSPYNIIGTYTIYAIHAVDDLGNDVVFIGRTRSNDLRRVLRYHRDGRKKVTAGDFSQAATSISPTIHVLSILNDCNAALAYKHNLSWYRHFEENGYVTLASEAFDYAAYAMLPETFEIYQKISQIEILPLLEKIYMPTVQANSAVLTKVKNKEKTNQMTQLNLKVGREERESFIALCQKNNKTQREMFGMLIANSSESAASEIIKEQSKIIRDQLEEITRLRDVPRGAKADIRLKQTLSLTKTVISRYLELMYQSRNVDAPSMKCMTWNSFVNEFPNRTIYDYPAEDGFFIMKLEAICYGKGRYSAVFLWGEDIEAGCYRKLRYYPKREYCGLSLPQNLYLHQGMLLLVGYRMAPDNAADLYITLPLIGNSLQLWSQATEYSGNEKRSLDEIIRQSQV